MITKEIYSGETHQWFMFGRDPSKPEKIIDTNQYMIRTPKSALLMDPGGMEIFSAMLASVVKQVPITQIHHLFASHQDPDIISSLGLWDTALLDTKLHAPWLWEGFIRHFGMQNIEYAPIADEGGRLVINGVEVQFIPAHYLHASGNYHVYDPVAKILMSGDVGAALEDDDAPLEVEDFEEHIPKMHGFHQRWMPSNEAKNDWIRRVRLLDIDMMCPQHGRVFTGDNVGKFLDWFEDLNVGIAIK
ncbi:flavoprotein [Enterovibrio norvegicus FF-33]|uniref:Flavoprotein n=1 Tax=Enterovibrio norvegicus FF-454 TaxID=1185651 RepID=A0A1E5C146_9GAMM|nr:MBL fold metallo-hydrolase [Enterovibrio norvegicus]OEE59181.1 flavoprotein [Enterovibrio norvegicus FF-454]OEE67661.1 flavoprotein [Enterovibrio norvegicus FF-33]OEE87406.1 flavoprotein [Enterovibrio norvegicus FF-162]